MRKCVVCFMALWGVSLGYGQTIDGIRDASYGAPRALQDTPTGFGNNLSELNGAYGVAAPDGSLSLMLTGNLENGGNGLVIFIDSKPGGAVASTLPGGEGVIGSVGGQRSDDWGTDIDGSTSVAPTPGGGSILDAGFNPDYAWELNIFDQLPGDEFIEYYVNIIDLTLPNEPSDNRDIYLGQSFLGDPAITQSYVRDGGTFPAGDITHAFDNDNVDGVLGYDFGTPPGPLGDPRSANTGFEALFSTEFLGGGVARDTSLPIRILPFITNGGGDYLANQFLPGISGAPNLGGAGGDGGTPLFDSTLFAGNNFITFWLTDADFNNDGVYDCQDINALTNAVATGGSPATYDLNGDGLVTTADIDTWRSDAGSVNLGPGRSYLPADADLSGTVDGSDFGVWNSGKFTSNTAWCSGNFNGDAIIDGSDFGLWNANKFTSSDGTVAVPEPAGLALGFLLLGLLRRRS